MNVSSMILLSDKNVMKKMTTARMPNSAVRYTWEHTVFFSRCMGISFIGTKSCGSPESEAEALESVFLKWITDLL